MSSAENSTRAALAAALADGPLREVRRALATASVEAAWVVGGTLRDLLLARPLKDVDLAAAGDAKTAARALHGALGGDIFSLSERFSTWRVQPADRDWGIDITLLRGETIEQDLALRDFSVNAMALPLAETVPSELIDPHGGIADLATKTLRVLGEHAYRDDPLRPLRLARLATMLDFTPDAATSAVTRKHAAGVTAAAPERIFAELRELVRAPAAVDGIELLSKLGLLAAVLPELAGLKDVEQSVYHHLDAYDHTLAVLANLIKIEKDLAAIFGEDAASLAAALAAPLADELTRGEALRWGALLHDIAKRETRKVYDGGHVGFPNHDVRGAEITRVICKRLKLSERLTQYLTALTREHLRLGFLVGERPLTRRQIYHYLRACEPVELEVGVLSAADRIATRGRKAEVAIEGHLQLARELNREALEWRAARPREPLVRGDRLAAELGIEFGPRLGELLELIEEARFAGELHTAADAVALARENL